MYPNTSRSETRRWGVVLHHSKCSSDRPLSTLWETKERSLAHTFLGAPHGLSLHNVFFFVCFGNKTIWPFFHQSLIWFCSLQSLWETNSAKRVTHWYLIGFPVARSPICYRFSIFFATSMSVELKAWPSVFHLKVIRLHQNELLQLCLVTVWNCLFTSSSQERKDHFSMRYCLNDNDFLCRFASNENENCGIEITVYTTRMLKDIMGAVLLWIGIYSVQRWKKIKRPQSD